MSTNPTCITVEEARALVPQAGRLDLSKYSFLSPDVLAELAKNEGTLILNGLRTLSMEQAVALSRHKGPLQLWEVSQVSDLVAEALAKHKGSLGIFPLAEMSDKARSILREHREAICNELGLPIGSRLKEFAGTFQQFQPDSDAIKDYRFLYYPRLPDPSPIFLHVCRKDDPASGTDKATPFEVPDWFLSLLPKIGECIDRIHLENWVPWNHGPGGEPHAYLLDATIGISTNELECFGISLVDHEGVYWETVVELSTFPAEYTIECWGGDYLQSADYLANLPLNHSIHHATLNGLILWQGQRRSQH
jgi:hypothetical protein